MFALCSQRAYGLHFRDQPRLSLSSPLSFDEAAMEVLDWLEECGFPWDMYVDLPAHTVRYCFRTLEDAAAFRQLFEHASQGRVVSGRH